MKRPRWTFTSLVLGLCLVAGLFAAFAAFDSAAAVGQAGTSKAAATTITVTAGKPSELAFKLSKFSSISAGTVTFKVTNMGRAFHTFKICTTAVTSSAKNSCVGTATKLLKPGQTATLTVKLTKNGLYEYLCTVPGHAAGGMKGLIGIGVKAKAPVAAKPTTTSSTTTTATTTPTGTTTATTTVATTTTGAPTGPDGCPAGQTIVSVDAQYGGDADGDDTGGASDGDGCY